MLTLLAAGCLILPACGDDDDEETGSGTPPTTQVESPPDEPAGDQTPDGTAADGTAPDGTAADGTAADGGGGTQDDGPTSIEDVIRAVFTGSEDPELICGELVTERFIRQAYGAREGCIAAQRPGALARSVDIEEVNGSGVSASAVAVPTGGPYGGVEVEVEMVSDPARDGAWQVDSLLADVPAGP
jgi:hypothetical protein